MKIAIDCRMSGKSGIGTFLDGILPYFSDGKNKLLLLGLPALPESFPFKENCVCCPCTVKMFSLKELFFFPHHLTKKINSCDIFFTPYCNIPNGIRIPIYATIHDIVFLDMPDIAGKFGTIVRKFFYQNAIQKCKALFTVSEFSKSRIQKKLHCKKPIHVVYNGIPKYLEKKINPTPVKTNTIIYIGNIKKHKGLQTLLKAFSLFRESKLFINAEKPKLVIIGSNENFRTKDSSLSEFITHSEQSGIVFTGHVTDDSLHEMLAESRVLVQPSLYEGFGIPPLEALYSGTNAIVSDIPVFKEIYGLFPVTFFSVGNEVSLLEKLELVWKDTELRTNIPPVYSYERTASLILEQVYQYLS